MNIENGGTNSCPSIPIARHRIKGGKEGMPPFKKTSAAMAMAPNISGMVDPDDLFNKKYRPNPMSATVRSGLQAPVNNMTGLLLFAVLTSI
jgi:hypothetical protein